MASAFGRGWRRPSQAPRRDNKGAETLCSAPHLGTSSRLCRDFERHGWGAWIRTRGWRNQNPLPYRLATPHQARRPGRRSRSGRTIVRAPRRRNTCLASPRSALAHRAIFLLLRSPQPAISAARASRSTSAPQNERVDPLAGGRPIGAARQSRGGGREQAGRPYPRFDRRFRSQAPNPPVQNRPTGPIPPTLSAPPTWRSHRPLSAASGSVRAAARGAARGRGESRQRTSVSSVRSPRVGAETFRSDLWRRIRRSVGSASFAAKVRGKAGGLIAIYRMVYRTGVLDSVDDTRAELLDRALELFAAYGYDGVGVQQICDAAGVTKPTLYHYFGSKRGVLEKLMEERLRALHAALAAVAAPERELAALLTNVASATFAYARTQPTFYRLYLTLWFAPARSEPCDVARRFHERHFEAIEPVPQGRARSARGERPPSRARRGLSRHAQQQDQPGVERLRRVDRSAGAQDGRRIPVRRPTAAGTRRASASEKTRQYTVW